MNQFTNLKELITYFSDEKVALAYLEDQLWGGKPTCPHCGHQKPRRLADGINFKCRNRNKNGTFKKCDSRFNVKVGTIYENTKLPLSTWFAALYLLTNHKKGISSYQLARDLGITQKSGWFVLHRLRKMLKNAQPASLAGVVQGDETYVKGEAKNRTAKKRRAIMEGRKKDPAAIVVGLTNEEEAILTVVPNAEQHTLLNIIQGVVKDKDSTIVTDGLNAYFPLKDIYRRHVVVNHAAGIFVLGEYHNQRIEGLFSLLKRSILGIYHNVSPWHLQSYCDEVTHRYNSRKITDVSRFTLTVQNSRGRLKYADLIRKRVTLGYGKSSQKSQEKSN